MNSRLLITLAIALLLAAGTFVAIRFAKGYRLNFGEKKVTPTGLLLANSYPEAASVYINEKLTTATNDTLHLPPGEYQVKILKDGFIPWEKKLTLEKEIVTQTNARLFPSVPDLRALTLTGAINPTPSLDGQKIAYAVASSSAELKNGLWVYDLGDRTLKLGSDQRQIARNTKDIDFTKTSLAWSPDAKQILVSTPDEENYLLSAEQMNNSLTLNDVSARLPLILEEWQESLKIIEEKKLEALPEFMQNVATASATQVVFSPDETKMLYTATASASIPENLLEKELPGRNTQEEQREISDGKVYVYDLEEDKNFFITDAPEPPKPSPSPGYQLSAISYQLNWFPDSRHLILTQDEKISIVEYDATNLATIYAGDFKENFVHPTPTGNALLILTSLSPDPESPANLYSLDLK